MARIPIIKKDGTRSKYFWSKKDPSELTQKNVYKQTDSGVKRMVGVHFNAVKMRLVRH